MGPLALDRHALLPALLAMAAVVAACLATGAGAVTGTAVSGTPRADVEEPAVPADALFPAEGPSMGLARQIAEGHWGGAACDGEVAVGWTPLEEGTNATASWRNPTDAWNNAGENFDCRIDFNSRADFDWPKLCSVMAHEVGHLLGRQHASDPDDLMAPLYSRPLAACAQAQDPARPVPPPVVEEPAAVVEAVVAPAPRPRRTAAGIRAAVKKRMLAERRQKRCRAARRTLRRNGYGRRARLARARAARCSFPRARRRPLR